MQIFKQLPNSKFLKGISLNNLNQEKEISRVPAKRTFKIGRSEGKI